MTDTNLKPYISDFKNFPKDGIIFRDIMPLFADPELLKKTIETLCLSVNKIKKCDVLVGIESRGFLFGVPMAFNLRKAFIAARKKGKLPGDVATETYALEYGHDTIEIQRERISPHKSYVIVDDLLATGGTASATARLIQKHGGIVAGFIFLIELEGLDGRSVLKAEFPNVPCESIICY